MPGQSGTPTTESAKVAGQAKTEPKTDASGLTEEQRAQVETLKQRDLEVRRHEAAHVAAGGPYAGSPTFTYATGPDGKRYATGGEVSIDLSPIPGDPAATLQKLRTVIAAALAPGEPSSQDRAVAAQARALMAEAEAQLAEKRKAEKEGQAAAAPTGRTKTEGQAEGDGRYARAASAYRGAGQAPEGVGLLALVA